MVKTTLAYSAQATLPQESDQLRLHHHSATSPFGLNATKATAPGAQLLTLTSSSTLHRPRCLRSHTNSGYIAIRLEHHQGHNARSPVAHFDELAYSAQATLPQESDQLRLHRHSATSPFGLNATKATTPGAQLFTMTSSSPQFTWTSSYQQFTLTSSSHQFTWTSSTQLFTLTSSASQFTWTSSFQRTTWTSSTQLFTLTSSSHQFALMSSSHQYT